jgi:hypothetical protein
MTKPAFSSPEEQILQQREFFDSFSQTLGFCPSNEAMYQEGVRRGGTVVSVRADDSQIDEIADTLNRSGAVDIDTRAAEWQVGSWKAKETKSELRSSESVDILQYRTMLMLWSTSWKSDRATYGYTGTPRMMIMSIVVTRALRTVEAG